MHSNKHTHIRTHTLSHTHKHTSTLALTHTHTHTHTHLLGHYTAYVQTPSDNRPELKFLILGWLEAYLICHLKEH